MESYGFFRVAAAIPEVRVADCDWNRQQIQNLVEQADKQGVRMVCFPELSISAYSCGDLFLQKTLILEAERAIARLIADTATLSTGFIVGAPVACQSKLYNCALICKGGRIRGIVPKTFLPNYSEFYEKRWFDAASFPAPVVDIEYAGATVPFGTNLLFELGFENARFAVEICEDVWSVVPPSSSHAVAGAQLIFNLSASDELIGKQQYVKSLISQQSARCQAAYVYAAAGFGESSTDLVYAGNAYIYENGKQLAESERFRFGEQLIFSEIDFDLLNSERRKNTTFVRPATAGSYRQVPSGMTPGGEPVALSRAVNPAPFVPSAANRSEACEEIFSIQVAGLAQRLRHTRSRSLLVGVSGGLDSTLALLVCVKTVDKLGLPRETVRGVTMPGFGTTGRTHANALQLMQSLGIDGQEINIVDACRQHFKDIGHDPDCHDITYENTQARERTQILMDLANQYGGLVVGTGDLSELALGWATYGGDHLSMYAVNSGIPKTLVRHLVRWAAETQIDTAGRSVLLDILDTPVSPELLPAGSGGEITQLTEEVVGPYELHDFFLYYTLRYGFTPDKILYLATQAFRET
ncbi:MAG: NAD(+) synthase, partial [Dysgonamonadaceae bacterium]|nr:NAD(+) synthase [Dysgonamonadaceae bacterium]